MSERRKATKPVGTTGPVVLTHGPQGSTAEFRKLEFPRTKEEIEKFIVQGFLRVAIENQFFPAGEIEASQNEQDNFDFSLKIQGTLKSLELMEIAPLEHLQTTYDKAPESYKPYDFAKYIFEKIMAKSLRYRASNKGGLILLAYVTDWHFILSVTVVALLQYWLCHTQHCFEAVYCYSPIENESGVVEVFYPTPKDFWKSFDAENYKENVLFNFNLTGRIQG
jgi:hypothetical protein